VDVALEAPPHGLFVDDMWRPVKYEKVERLEKKMRANMVAYGDGGMGARLAAFLLGTCADVRASGQERR
jgi:hypothetical protein